MKAIWSLLIVATAFGFAACGGEKEEPELTAREETPAPEAEAEPQEEKVPVPEGTIKINEVTAEVLASYKITGLAGKTSEKFIAHRDANGPFKNWEDIDAVPGVGEKMLEKLKERGVDFGEFAAPSAEPAEGVAASGTEPKTVPPSAGAGAGAKTAKVNVNKAGVEELMNLNGVGKSTAEKIVAYRQEHGPFKKPEDLDAVSGIGAAKIDGFRAQLVF